jgi:hypothetical protein
MPRWSCPVTSTFYISSSVTFLLVALQPDNQSDELLVPKSAKVLDEQYLKFTITPSVHGLHITQDTS